LAKTAAVAFVQRFGGALNCNVHGHVLLPDGVFVLERSETFTLVPLPPPENQDLLRLTQKLARRVTALLERRFGTLEPAEDDVLQGAIGEGMQNVPLPSTDAGSEDAPDVERPTVRTSRRAASACGFSIHANTAVPAHHRVGLEKLCRYGMRPAFSQERLSLSEAGQVIVHLRRPWPTRGGVSVLSFEPVAFLRRLAPLIPPPYAHLVRHYGLFAPNAKGRELLPAAPVSWGGIRIDAQLRADRSVTAPRTSGADAASSAPDLPPAAPHPEPPHPELRPLAAIAIAPETSSAPSAQGGAGPPRRRVLPWAELLRRVFALDVLVCGKCGGPMTVLAFLTDPAVVEKILTHLGLPASPPTLSPARLPAQVEMFDEPETMDLPSNGARARRSRGPPEQDDVAWPINPPTDPSDWGA
jgi:hypothetical protein